MHITYVYTYIYLLIYGFTYVIICICIYTLYLKECIDTDMIRYASFRQRMISTFHLSMCPAVHPCICCSISMSMPSIPMGDITGWDMGI